MLRCRCLIACCVFVCMPAAVAMADEAKKAFDALYSQKIRQVTGTADRADDVALVKEMVTVAKDSGGTPALQILICNAAADLGGKHPDGYAVAIDAMQLLANEREEERDSARTKLIDLLTRQSRTGKPEERAGASDVLIDLLITMGDEKREKRQYAEAGVDYRRANTLALQRKSAAVDGIRAKLDSTAARDRALKQIARLQEKLLKDANDHVAAEEIVRLYIRDLNDPNSIEPFRTRMKDNHLVKLAPLAKADLTGLNVDDSLALGEWYKELAVGLPDLDAAALLDRSHAYLTRFLSHDAAAGIARTKAEVMRKDVEAMQKKIAAAVQTTSAIASSTDNGTSSSKNESMGITILDAQYGADGGWVDVTPKVKKMVQKDRLVVHVGTWLVGYDPKFGANKSLIVHYKIGAQEEKVTTGDGGVFVLFTASRSTDTSPLTIVEARYGGNDGWIDVTRNVRAKVREGALTVVADMAVLGVDRDPAVNVHKNLILFYFAKGEPSFKVVRTNERGVLP